MLVKSVQLGLSRCAGRPPIAETPQKEANPPPPQRPSEPSRGRLPKGAVLRANMLAHSRAISPI
eukprot:989870-Alexandrium_andersonii.AAC.1